MAKSDSRKLHFREADSIIEAPSHAHRVLTVPEGAIFDSDEYYPRTLNYWLATFSPLRTIWFSGSLWFAFGKVVTLALLTAIMVFFLSPRPQDLKCDRFLLICKFLAFFVGFLLGLFIVRGLGRWYTCTNGFLELCDAVRNLHMQLCALGASDELVDLCVRYGLVSATLLHFSLLTEGMDLEESKAERAEMWARLRTSDVKNLGHRVQLDDKEYSTLRKLRDPSGVMWMWVTSLIARMAQDGQIPPMQSATYGRVLELAKAAHSGIRVVRASISIQTPFLVSHVLASLVHINNILNAICLGLVVGSLASELAIKHGYHPLYHGRVSQGEIARDTQVSTISYLLNLLGPLLFQALFEISLAIAQPFQSRLSQLPIGLITDCLINELEDQVKMAKTTPYWKVPCYRGDGFV